MPSRPDAHPPSRSTARSHPIARALVGWLESAAPLAPGADRSAGLACCGAAATAEQAPRARRWIDSWIAK